MLGVLVDIHTAEVVGHEFIDDKLGSRRGKLDSTQKSNETYFGNNRGEHQGGADGPVGVIYE
jgi:hypothetical protein